MALHTYIQRLVTSIRHLSIFALLILLAFTMYTYQYHYFPFFYNDAYASTSGTSPSFVRQEIVDASHDWTLWKGPSANTSKVKTHDGHLIQISRANNISECISDENKFFSPDIESVSYISDGNVLNATVWLTDSFKEPPSNDTLDIYQEQMKIKVSNLTKNTSLEKYATLEIARLYDPLNHVIIEKEERPSNSTTTIDGNPVYKVIYSNRAAQKDENGNMIEEQDPLRGEKQEEEQQGIGLTKMTIWTVKNDKIYEITYSAQTEKYNDYSSVIKKMINSIQFIDPSSSSDKDKNINDIANYTARTASDQYKNTSSTYRSNDELEFDGPGIKMHYPADWTKQEQQPADDGSKEVIFRSPFEDERSDIPSWHETTFTMAIGIDSVHREGITDYRVMVARNPINHDRNNNNNNNNNNSIINSTNNSNRNNTTSLWTKKVLEVSAYDKERVLEEENNYTGFYDTEGDPYILFSFDLGKVNYPQQYKAVFYITDLFIKNHRLCRLLDTTNWVIIPPPDFTITTNPSSLLLRPGEEKNVELIIKGNTRLESSAFFSVDSNYDNKYNKFADLQFIPNTISIPAGGGAGAVGTSILDVKVLGNTKAATYTFPIIANISFPTSITNRGGETFNNTKSVSLLQTSNLTLTVLSSYTPEEHLNNFVNAWITPIMECGHS
jgi:hypothetical protein